MMQSWNPWKIIGLGFILVLLGMLIPLLIVIQVIQSTFILNFLAFTASMAGMIIGFIGMTFIVRIGRGKSDDNKYD